MNDAGVRAGERSAPRSYRSNQRESQARLTRQRVLTAATTVFLARGYGGATMRAIADESGVSLATVELLFGTKAHLLKAAIDVAIVGDDDAAAVLERAWTDTALQAADVEGLLSIVGSVIAPAQMRSAGLVLAVFEGSSTDSELAELARQRITQRETTAAWIIDALASKTPLRAGCSRQEAVETLWILMDPAVFDRLVRHRQWSVEQYQDWFARSARRLLVADDARQTEEK